GGRRSGGRGERHDGSRSNGSQSLLHDVPLMGWWVAIGRYRTRIRSAFHPTCTWNRGKGTRAICRKFVTTVQVAFMSPCCSAQNRTPGGNPPGVKHSIDELYDRR